MQSDDLLSVLLTRRPWTVENDGSRLGRGRSGGQTEGSILSTDQRILTD